MDRLSEIRARCEAAKTEKAKGNAIDCAALSWAIVQNDIPYLLSLLEETWEWDMYQCAKREIERLRGILAEQNARLNQYEAENRWIPVSDRLPPDDKPVLAFGHTVRGTRTTQFKGRWIAAHTMLSGDFGADDDMALEYDEEEDEFYVPEGWFERIENWDDYTDVAVGDYIVTHWRPLPEPPKEGE